MSQTRRRGVSRTHLGWLAIQHSELVLQAFEPKIAQQSHYFEPKTEQQGGYFEPKTEQQGNYFESARYLIDQEGLGFAIQLTQATSEGNDNQLI